MDPATQEDAILDIVTAIYNSRVIPESHKESYVEHIQKNGMTEKMVDELENIFAEEAAAIESEIQDKQQLVEGLEETKASEQRENDQFQAEILAAIDEYGKQDEERAKRELEEVAQVFEEVGEELKEEKEQQQIADIESKLKNK